MRPQRLRLVNFLSHADSELFLTAGGPTLLLGRNKDDLGQEGNGSGKSALIEGIAFALLGQPLRAVKMQEVLRRQATELLVELELWSVDETIIITRTMASGRASAITVRVNGQLLVQPSVQAYNEWVLQKLGFTRQDLLDYFLITKDRHQPFLAQPDAQKKQILSRFTKLEQLDKLVALLPVWSQETEQALQRVKLALSKAQASAELNEELLIKWSYENQVLASQQLLEKHAKASESWQLVKIGYEEKIKILSSEINSYLLPEVTGLTELSASEKEVLIKLDQLLGVLAELRELEKTLKQEFSTDNEAHQQAINALLEKKHASQQQLSTLQAELNSLTNLTKEALTCPSCKHVFWPGQKLDFTLPELTLAIDEVKQELSLTEKKAEHLDSELSIKKLTFTSKEQAFFEDLALISQEEKTYLAQKTALLEKGNQLAAEKKKKEKLHEQAQAFLRDKKEALDLLRQHYYKCLADEPKKTDTTELIALYEKERWLAEKKLSEANELIEQLKIELTSLEVRLLEKQAWKLHLKKFRSWSLLEAIQQVENLINFYLTELETDLQVKFSTHKEKANGDLKDELLTEVIRKGISQGSYGQFSAGERARLDLACTLALQQALNLHTTTPFDLLLLDEVLDACDAEGMAWCLKALQKACKTSLVVSQRSISGFELTTVLVEKTNGASQLTKQV